MWNMQKPTPAMMMTMTMTMVLRRRMKRCFGALVS